MLIGWFFLAGLIWSVISEFTIMMVLHFGKLQITGKRPARTLYRWTLFALGELNLAIAIAMIRWFEL